jgi:hypothetical protein
VLSALRILGCKPATIRYDQVSSRKGRPRGERHRKAITDAAIGQQKILARTPHRYRRKQVWDRRTGAHDLAESNTPITTRCEVARPAAPYVVTHDSDGSNSVMQPIECCALELFETRWYKSAQYSQHAIEPASESDVQTVRYQMPATEAARIADELVDRETNRGIVCGHNRTRARANDHIDGHLVCNQLLKHSDMTGPAEAAATQHKADTRGRVRNMLVRMAELSERRRQPVSRCLTPTTTRT